MSKRPYTRYTNEFKQEALCLADKAEKPVTQVARELGLRVNQIYKWKKQLELKQGSPPTGQAKTPDKDAEIRRLKQALDVAHEENTFLKKTAIFFAKNQP